MISVVIPVRNRAELVKRTLDSLARQTVAPEAVILVDNGSTDHTLETLQRWADGRPNVAIVEEPRPGAAVARNAGMAKVTTPYVLFFDSDDVMPPRHIEDITAGLKIARMPEIGAFDMALVSVDGRRHEKPYRHGDPMKMQIFHSILSTQRCVLSTDLARSVGGWNESLRVWDDLEFGVRLLASDAKVSFLPLSEPAVAYAQTESITGLEFASKSGSWERALDACQQAVAGTRYERMIDMRRAILAGMYRREGRRDLSRGLTHGFKMRVIELYVALGGRGVAYLA